MKTLLLIVGLMSSLAASADDWNYFGGSKSVGGSLMDVFYKEDFTKNADGHIQVWMKGIPESAISLGNDKEAIQRVVDKLGTYYVPPFAIASSIKLNRDNLMGILAAEDVANNPAKTHLTATKMLFEIDCSGSQWRTLSVFTKKGGRSWNGFSEWEHVMSETNMITLQKIVCSSPPIKGG